MTPPVAVLHSLVAAAATDAKTGVLTCRAWWNETGRHAAPGAVLMIDVDRFAALDAREGHLAADAVLAGIARVLVGSAGPGAVVGRFGGDGFVVFVPGEDAGGHRAEAVRRSVAGLAVPVDGPAGPRVVDGVTVSVGVAAGAATPATMWAADNALYRAKHAGGDAVEVAETP